MIKPNIQIGEYNKPITRNSQLGNRHKSSIQLLAIEKLEYIETNKEQPLT